MTRQEIAVRATLRKQEQADRYHARQVDTLQARAQAEQAAASRQAQRQAATQDRATERRLAEARPKHLGGGLCWTPATCKRAHWLQAAMPQQSHVQAPSPQEAARWLRKAAERAALEAQRAAEAEQRAQAKAGDGFSETVAVTPFKSAGGQR